MSEQKKTMPPSATELSEAELDAVVGGTDQAPPPTNSDVVGGALTAGKVAVPWSVMREKGE